MHPLVQLPDGTYQDTQTGDIFPDLESAQQYYGSADISMTSTSVQPSLPQRSFDPQTSALSGFLNSAGAFGVSLASILSGRPVAVNAAGQPVGAPGSVQVRPASGLTFGSLLLIGLGVFLVVKLAK